MRLQLQTADSYQTFRWTSIDVSISFMQVIVFDKLEYCGTLKNLGSVMDKPNFKVSNLLSLFHVLI